MSLESDIFNSDQLRAARSLLDWSQQELATRAQVAVSTIADFERGVRNPMTNNLKAIRRVVEQGGVVFIEGGVRRGIHWTFVTEGSIGSLLAVFDDQQASGMRELIEVFGSVESGTGRIASVQCASPELKAKLVVFVEKYGKSGPHLFRVRKIVTDLRDGEFFLILPLAPTSSAEVLATERLLHQLNHPNENAYEAEYRETFGPLLEHYDMRVAQTDKRVDIGNARRADRLCRFCGRSEATGATFESEAHAIATSMGNKLLKLNDECDECNLFFGQTLETTLTELLNVQRVSLGIEGRGGKPTIQMVNGEMRHDGDKMVVIANRFSEEAGGVLTAQLGTTGRKVVPQYFYRALAKIALSVMPAEQLPPLKDTIHWVRYGTGQEQPLPKIAAANVFLAPNPSAQITLYLRRDDGSRLPHVVGEFRLGYFMYVFALPFSERDDWNLVEFFEEQTFKSTFRHYRGIAWKPLDYSSTRETVVSHTIRMEPQ
jgi:transcriptional regulator with XRE-family HTH domain